MRGQDETTAPTDPSESDDKDTAISKNNNNHNNHNHNHSNNNNNGNGIPLGNREHFPTILPMYGVGSETGIKANASPVSSNANTPNPPTSPISKLVEDGVSDLTLSHPPSALSSPTSPHPLPPPSSSNNLLLATAKPSSSPQQHQHQAQTAQAQHQSQQQSQQSQSQQQQSQAQLPSRPPSTGAASAKSFNNNNNSNQNNNIQNDRLPAPKPTKSMLGKLFEPNRPSSAEPTSRASPIDKDGAHLNKDKDAGVGNSLRELVEKHAPKLKRGSSMGSRKSDDGNRSESDGHGKDKDKDDKKSVVASSTTSLMKKYGVCEKVAIGKGATAVVRLAHKWDRSTEKLYAVKEFRKRKKNETEKEYVKKLTSEFCISSTLHHENVVETVDLVQDENHHWCEVMEYCPGGDLYAAIKRGNMTTKEIESYFKQIVNGIAYIHSMGVAHRDIKPENLLLDVRGRVKITDFGVSDVFRMCWEKTTHYSKGLCGSPPYIAPEQFVAKEYDARLVDVWATAIVLYCLYFQELPWREAKLTEAPYSGFVHAYASSNSPPPLSNLPREARHIVKRMLDPTPKTRAHMEEILKDKWVESITIVDTKPPGLALSV